MSRRNLIQRARCFVPGAMRPRGKADQKSLGAAVCLGIKSFKEILF